MSRKKELIKMIEEMPDDIHVFIAPEGSYGDVNIKVFLKPCSEEFYEWYFGI